MQRNGQLPVYRVNRSIRQQPGQEQSFTAGFGFSQDRPFRICGARVKCVANFGSGPTQHAGKGARQIAPISNRTRWQTPA
jgi:hypothetical protein